MNGTKQKLQMELVKIINHKKDIKYVYRLILKFEQYLGILHEKLRFDDELACFYSFYGSFVFLSGNFSI